jgi:putative restriction endonuclease
MIKITEKRRSWTRNELILAFNLYCQIPFGRIHIRNPEIIALAARLQRSPSAVSWKLANLARLDPTLAKRNIKGATHGPTAVNRTN